MKKLRIFVSGTNDDMQPERDAVSRAVDSIEIAEGIRAEHQVSRDQSPKDWILEEIEACNIYLGVFSHRYGWIIPDENISATEFEFNRAKALQKPILIWIRKPRAEEIKLPHFNRQEEFLKRASEFSIGRMRQEFHIVGDLERWVADGLRETFIKIIQQFTDHSGPALDPSLIDGYLEDLARQNVLRDWEDDLYIERNVAPIEGLLKVRSEAGNLSKSEVLEKAVTGKQKVILLGAPGMGKTTSLRHLEQKTASQHLVSKGSKNGVVDIPIYVDLKNYNGEEELERLLAYRVNEVLRPRSRMLASDLAESTKVIKGWLAQPTARFLLLFDGLNEIRPEHHTKVRHLLKAFITSQHHIVITCRESDYDESLDGRTTLLVLTPLGLNDIYDYLRRVLGDQGKQFFYEQQIISSKKMEALASTPLALWLIAFVAKSSPEADLPANRGRLIGRFVELMPKLRQREGIQRQVSYDIVISLLAKLAFKMQNLKRLTADLGELRQWQLPTADLQLETVLIQAKEWRFLKADGGMGEPVEFLHQLFLEYFASAYLDSELQAGMSFEEAVGDRLFSDHWVEVIVMLAGITDRPSRLVQWLSQRIKEKNDWRRAVLVERCWRTTGASDDAEATAAVVDSLLVPLATGESSEKGIRYRGVDPYVRQNAIRALAKIGAPAVEPLITSLKEGLGVGAGAADALREIGDKRAVKPLIMALADEDSELRQRAAVALGKFGDARAAKPLFAALSDEDEDVRTSAAEALGEIGDRDIVEPLIELLEGQGEEFSWLIDTDPDEGELEDLFLNAPLAASLIGNPLALGSDELRQLAAIALGIIGDERATRPLLAALKYRKDPDVRWRAAEALGNLGSRQAIPTLKRAALEDKSDSSWGSVADAAQKALQKLIQVKPRRRRRGER